MPELELPRPEELQQLTEDPFTKRVALATAIYAVILAIASLGGNYATKEMLLAQQQASDQWAFYQAKTIREHLYRAQKLTLEAELAEHRHTMAPESRQQVAALLAQFAQEERRYATEKTALEHDAKQLERERDLHRTRDPYFAYAEGLFQIAIVLASISILARSRSVFLFSLGLALLGVLLTINGYTLAVHVPLLHTP